VVEAVAAEEAALVVAEAEAVAAEEAAAVVAAAAVEADRSRHNLKQLKAPAR
jgi:hypothetical protein